MDGAYNSEMYKRKSKPVEHQEDYCGAVYKAWCLGEETTDEHQKPSATIDLGPMSMQGSDKPSQF